jgi:Ammonium Transporter Family
LKLPILLLFCALWFAVVYVPIYHMLWYWAGSEATVAAAKALSSPPAEAKASAQAAMDTIAPNAGLAFLWGALDFAEGAVVYIPIGIAELLCSLMLPQPAAQADEVGVNEGTTLVGALLFAIGWLGAIAGSHLEMGTSGIIDGNWSGRGMLAPPTSMGSHACPEISALNFPLTARPKSSASNAVVRDDQKERCALPMHKLAFAHTKTISRRLSFGVFPALGIKGKIAFLGGRFPTICE